MGFQIYDKVLIRILLSQPLPRRLLARVFYDVDGRAGAHTSPHMRMDVRRKKKKTKTTKNLIKRKYLPGKRREKHRKAHNVE